MNMRLKEIHNANGVSLPAAKVYETIEMLVEGKILDAKKILPRTGKEPQFEPAQKIFWSHSYLLAYLQNDRQYHLWSEHSDPDIVDIDLLAPTFTPAMIAPPRRRHLFAGGNGPLFYSIPDELVEAQLIVFHPRCYEGRTFILGDSGMNDDLFKRLIGNFNFTQALERSQARIDPLEGPQHSSLQD